MNFKGWLWQSDLFWCGIKCPKKCPEMLFLLDILSSSSYSFVDALL